MMSDISPDKLAEVVEVHDTYMNEHELYLLRCKNGCPLLSDKEDIHCRLMKYYRIVVAFDLEPYCMIKKEYVIEKDAFCALKESMTDAEKRAWRRLIVHALNQNNTLDCFALSQLFYEVSQIELSV